MDYFFIVKLVGDPSQQVKCSISLPHEVTVNTHCHVTMGLWLCLGNYVMSQWIGDVAIDTKQSWDKQPALLLYKIHENLDLLHKMVGKNGYFNSKTESSHTSQDK